VKTASGVPTGVLQVRDPAHGTNQLSVVSGRVIDENENTVTDVALLPVVSADDHSLLIDIAIEVQ
jgi:hypothetical protein